MQPFFKKLRYQLVFHISFNIPFQIFSDWTIESWQPNGTFLQEVQSISSWDLWPVPVASASTLTQTPTCSDAPISIPSWIVLLSLLHLLLHLLLLLLLTKLLLPDHYVCHRPSLDQTCRISNNANVNINTKKSKRVKIHTSLVVVPNISFVLFGRQSKI